MSVVKVADAQSILEEKDLEAVVVLGVAADGTVSMAAWAATPKKRVAIDEWALWVWRNALRPDPFETVFGAGHGGKPTPLPGEGGTNGR